MGKVSRKQRRQRRSCGQSAYSAEVLEQRCLLAGVTVITHGYGLFDDKPWVAAMANAVAARAGGTGLVTQYTLTIDTGVIPYPLGTVQVKSFNFDGGQHLQSSDPGEVVIKVDWTGVDGGVPCVNSVPTSTIAALVQGALLNPGVQPSDTGLFLPANFSFAQLPMHLIGHSRGASVMAALAKNLGAAGVWVDQVTFLDSHPTACDYGNGLFDDLEPTENVMFADSYWRSDGSFSGELDGESVPGAHDVELDDLVLGAYGYQAAHSNVHLWYHGTIDTSLSPLTDGDNSVTPVANSAGWYSGNDAEGDARGSRANVGYRFSRIGGGIRPPDGIGPILGGSAHRRSVSPDRSGQWPNIANLKISDGRSSFAIAELLHVDYLYQDSDTNAASSFYLDTDSNPYNGNGIPIVTGRYQQTTLANVWSDGIYLPTAGIAPGAYYVYAKISDDTHARYAYAPTRITLATPTAQQGNALALSGIAWRDQEGDNDSIPEAGETLEPEIRLVNNSGDEVTNVSATLSSNIPAVDISAPNHLYGDLSPDQDRWGRFRLQASVLPNTLTTFTLRVTYDQGGSSYYQDLVFTEDFHTVDNSVGIDHVVLHDDRPNTGDGDGVPEGGELVEFDLYLRNQSPNGSIFARNIQARVISVSAGHVDSHWCYYPDLQGGGATPQKHIGNGSCFYFDTIIPRDFSGQMFADVEVKYDGLTTPQLISRYPLFTVPDISPPSPNPSSWKAEPFATGPRSIKMVAARANDPSGVEYYFHEMSGNPGGSDSGWQPIAEYEDIDLSPDTIYTYEVRTRDKSINQYTGAPSVARSARTDPLPSVTITELVNLAGEPSNNGKYRISRTGNLISALAVDFAVGGSATRGDDDDYLLKKESTILTGDSVIIDIGQRDVEVEVSVKDDKIDEDIESVILSLLPGSSYAVGTPASGTVDISDDDTADIIVTPTSSLVTTEAAGTAKFSVKLNSQPTGDVSIALSSSDTTESTVSPRTLTFKPSDWDNAQEVTVTGVDDSIDDGDVAYKILIAAATNTDPKYNGIGASELSLTNRDDDPPPPPPPPCPPANDKLIRATSFRGILANVTGSNVCATKQRGEPIHANKIGGASVWWQWKAPGEGVVTIDTSGSNFDTLLAVYRGGANFNTLTLIKGNDDVASEVLWSRVKFNVKKGIIYRIAIDGFHGDVGGINLNLRFKKRT